jgi:hypothetical protein
MTVGNLTRLAERLRVKFIGGVLCLDFVNTVGGRAAGEVIRGKIGSYDDLLGWGRLAGSLDAGCARSLASLADDRPQRSGCAKRCIASSNRESRGGGRRNPTPMCCALSWRSPGQINA